MRINSGNIGMESARSYSSVTKKSGLFYRGSSKSLKTGDGKGFLGGFWAMEDGDESAKESGNAQTTLQDITLHFRNLSNTGRIETGMDEKKAIENIRQSCMNFLMYILFGDKYKREYDWRDSRGSLTTASSESVTVGYTNSYYHSETEETYFATNGVVKTADGREISFGLSLGMSRSFQEYYEENFEMNLKQTRYCDPLVINLDANIAGLSDQKFYFDLDCDGEEEEISTLQAGSGFLALDLNRDGVINDGSELFGTSSGDGFKDLAQYDTDKDGWIDEDDYIWDKLQIWCKDETGQDKLYTLAEAGVGAICLQNAATEFSLNSMQDNHNNGVIRSTAVFLYENGNVGTVQHLDLAQ